MPILFFQVAIALSIFAAGYRYRHMAAAAWALFTLAMVFTYWLAFIQFVTIGVSWYYAGVPFGATHYKTLLARASGLRMGKFGYFELDCFKCIGCRCRGASIKLRGSWPLLSAVPNSASLITQRAELARELENEARQLEARRSGHYLVRRMQAAAKELRLPLDPEFDRKECKKYLWINEYARLLQKKYVQRLSLVDLLPGITVLSIPVFLFTLFIDSAAYYDNKEVKTLIVMASITIASYLLQVLIGLYWLLRRRFMMPHLFVPGGRFLSLEQAR